MISRWQAIWCSPSATCRSAWARYSVMSRRSMPGMIIDLGTAAHGAGGRLLIRPWEREWAHLVGGSPERVPVRPAAPHALSGRLGARAQLREIDAGNAAVLH